MFCSRAFGIWLLKKHTMPAAEIGAMILKLMEQGLFFQGLCLLFCLHVNPVIERTFHGIQGRPQTHHQKCKNTNSHEHTHRILHLFIWHLCVGHVILRRWCYLSFLFAFSTIDCSSPTRMDSLMQLTVSFLALLYFWRLDIWWVVVGVQRGEFCPFGIISISFSRIQCHTLPLRPSFWQISPINVLSVGRSPHCWGTVEEERRSGLGAFNGNRWNTWTDCAEIKLGKRSFLLDRTKGFAKLWDLWEKRLLE